MLGGWMPQATRLPFASRTGMHTQAGRRSPRRTGSPVTALKTWLGFVLYLRNVTPWKEHLNYKRPGPPGCLLAQAGPQPGGRPGARPLPEPGRACLALLPYGFVPPKLATPAPTRRPCHEGSRSTTQTGAQQSAQRAAAAPRHGTLRAQRPLCPLALPSFWNLLSNASWTSVCRRLQGKAEPEPRLRGWGRACAGTAPCAPCGVQCGRSATTREGPASTRHGPGALRARRHYKDLSKPQGGRESRRREATRPGVTAAPMDSTPGQTKGLGVIPAGSRTVSPGEKTLPSVRPQRAQSSPPGGLGHGEAPRTDLRMNCAQPGGY